MSPCLSPTAPFSASSFVSPLFAALLAPDGSSHESAERASAEAREEAGEKQRVGSVQQFTHVSPAAGACACWSCAGRGRRSGLGGAAPHGRQQHGGGGGAHQ